MARGYQILEHPSDLGIEAFGDSLAQAFEEAARGLISIIIDPASVRPSTHVDVTCNGIDLEQLLVNWLSEILYLYDGRQFIPIVFEVHRLDASSLHATISGEQFSPSRHKTRLDVKAVTYHQLRILGSEKGATVRVYLDI